MTETPASPQRAAFLRDDVELIHSEELQRGFFRLERLTLRHRLFDGGFSDSMQREVHVRPNAVGVLLYDPPRDVLVFVEQFRVGALEDPESPWKLELVAGLSEPGESDESVACREAQEEAGCRILELCPVHQYYPSPGACTERVTLFCGLVNSEGLGGTHGLDDEHEDIRVHLVTFQQAQALMQQGRLDNAMSLIGMHWLSAQRASLRALPADGPRLRGFTKASICSKPRTNKT